MVKIIFDDIAAPATPPGEGGIAIVRLSGENVINIIDNVFLPYNPDVKINEKKGYTLTLGWILDEAGQKVDEVLLGVMYKPRSYTGENTVEINCHGGTLAARRCLDIVLKQGVRLAEPGEFTRRAFLNGRIDISQAEAVIDIIKARTEKALTLAMRQLDGQMSRQIKFLEEDLIGIQAMLNASIDFPDDVGEPDYDQIKDRILAQKEALEAILRAGQRGEIYREGVAVAIVGKPNVGKSSLLNLLLKKEKAIVTHIPGTTRDIIEGSIIIRGIPVRIMDTAGIRKTDDLVESIGVEKSRKVIKDADIVLFLLDAGTGLEEEDLEIFNSITGTNVIVLVNKDDIELKRIGQKEVQKRFSPHKIIWASVAEKRGLEELEETIESMALSNVASTGDLEYMINVRQRNALERAGQQIEEIINGLGIVSLDCLAVDFWGVLECLGEISGRNLKEDVLDRIFQDFCIGK